MQNIRRRVFCIFVLFIHLVSVCKGLTCGDLCRSSYARLTDSTQGLDLSSLLLCLTFSAPLSNGETLTIFSMLKLAPQTDLQYPNDSECLYTDFVLLGRGKKCNFNAFLPHPLTGVANLKAAFQTKADVCSNKITSFFPNNAFKDTFHQLAI